MRQRPRPCCAWFFGRCVGLCTVAWRRYLAGMNRAGTAQAQGRPAIRPVVAADLPALKHVIAANGLFPPDMLDAMTAPFLDGSAGRDRWLAADDGGPIAVAYYVPERMTEGTWNVLLLAVHPDRHGQGIGTALQRHIEQTLAAEGQRVLLVETSGLPEFARTRGFYRMLGFEEEARIREFYQAGEDKVIFRKSLV